LAHPAAGERVSSGRSPDEQAADRGTAAGAAVPIEVEPAFAPGSRGSAGGVRRLAQRLSSSRTVRRFATGAFWSVFGNAVSRALTLVASVLVARRLGAAQFGEYSLVLATVGMFQNVAGFGLVTTSAKLLSGKYKADPPAAGAVVALSRIVAAATGWTAMLGAALAAPWLARNVLDAPQLEDALRVGSILLLFGPIHGAQLGVLTGLERFKVVAVVSVITALVAIPLLVIGAAAGGTMGCVIAQVAVTVLMNVLYAGAVRRALHSAGIPPHYRGALREWRVLFTYSLPTMLSNILLGAVIWGTATILAHQPDGYSEVGVFSAANQWRNGIVLVTTAAGAALLPLFSDLHDNGTARALRRAFWMSFALSAGACVVGAGGVAILSPEIMGAYGAEFADSYPVLVLLAATAAVAGPLSVAGHAIVGAGRMWLSFALSVAWGGALLALVYALRAQGAYGASIAHVCAYGLHLVLATAAAAALLQRRKRQDGAGPRDAATPVRG
jgi:O-antigen/teichoic acid export membrane protein